MDRKLVWIFKVFLFVVFIILFLISGFIGYLEKSWIVILISAMGIFSIMVPSIIEKRFSADFSEWVEIIALLFINAYFYLGEYHNFFYKVWWWDLFLHGTGLFLIGLMSFSVVYLLNKKKNTAINLSPFFVAIFAFSFSLSIGSVWEIFEFSMDSFFGLNMQKTMFGDSSGLTDTMWDLIVGSLGALLASTLGYIYLKKDSPTFYKKVKTMVSLRKK